MHSRRRSTLLVLPLLTAFLACSEDPQMPAVPEVGHPIGELYASIPLPGRPFGVAATSDGNVLATRLDVNSVAIVRLDDLKITTQIPVAATPSWIIPGPSSGIAYVTHHFGQSIGVLDVDAASLQTTIPISGDAVSLILSPDGEKIYATNNSHTLNVVDVESHAILTTVSVGDAPYGLAFDPTQPRLYVSGRNSHDITVVDTDTHDVIQTVDVGGRPHDLAVSPDGTRLYIANEYGSLDVRALPSLSSVASVPIGAANGMALSPDGERLYIAASLDGAIHVVDTETLAVVHTFTPGGTPRKVTFSPDGAVAIVANEEGWLDLIR